MAIESVSGNTHIVSLPTSPVAKQVDTSKQQSANPASDVAIASQTTLDLQTLVSKTAAVPDINQDKVATLKAAVQSGTYQPNAERIASKMVKFEQQLPDST